jgi:Family of unknown function (DUF5681)
MKFKKGQSGNPTGRKKGAPNRTTEQLRSLIQSFIEDNWQRVQKDFDSMKPNERLSFLNSLLRFVLPEPTSFEKLSEDQLKQLHEYLLKKYSDEQTVKN